MQQQQQRQTVLATPTSQQSLSLVKNLLGTSLTVLVYLRNLFPEENFKDIQLNGLSLKSLKRSYSQEADELLDWMEKGVFHALENKYLKSLVFGIFLDPACPDELVEGYTFHFTYPSPDEWSIAFERTLGNETEKMEQNEASLSSQGHDESQGTSKDPMRMKTKTEIMRATTELLRRLLVLTQTLEPLPQNAYLTMKLFYYEDLTPLDYEPPCFKKGHEQESPFYFQESLNESVEKFKIGHVESSYHILSLSMQTKATQPIQHLNSSKLVTNPKNRINYDLEDELEFDLTKPNTTYSSSEKTDVVQKTFNKDESAPPCMSLQKNVKNPFVFPTPKTLPKDSKKKNLLMRNESDEENDLADLSIGADDNTQELIRDLRKAAPYVSSCDSMPRSANKGSIVLPPPPPSAASVVSMDLGGDIVPTPTRPSLQVSPKYITTQTFNPRLVEKEEFDQDTQPLLQSSQESIEVIRDVLMQDTTGIRVTRSKISELIPPFMGQDEDFLHKATDKLNMRNTSDVCSASQKKPIEASKLIQCPCLTTNDLSHLGLGLIQCKSCMTWQHAVCHGFLEEELYLESEASHVCAACSPKTDTGDAFLRLGLGLALKHGITSRPWMSQMLGLPLPVANQLISRLQSHGIISQGYQKKTKDGHYFKTLYGPKLEETKKIILGIKTQSVGSELVEKTDPSKTQKRGRPRKHIASPTLDPSTCGDSQEGSICFDDLNHGNKDSVDPESPELYPSVTVSTSLGKNQVSHDSLVSKAPPNLAENPLSRSWSTATTVLMMDETPRSPPRLMKRSALGGPMLTTSGDTLHPSSAMDYKDDEHDILPSSQMGFGASLSSTIFNSQQETETSSTLGRKQSKKRKVSVVQRTIGVL